MFAGACKNNRGSIYGVKGFSHISKTQQNYSTGSGFTVAPGILVTCAHLVHVENNVQKPIHSNFEVIRSPDIGQKMEAATFIVEDPKRDIALLKITSPRSARFLTLEPGQVPTGTCCGSLGFPLSQMVQTPQGISFFLTERFQGSYISSYITSFAEPSGINGNFYETDSVMYNGSSGCPGFLTNSNVFGMQSRSLLGNSPINNSQQGQKHVPDNRLSISMWVPSMDIIKFAQNNGII